MGMRAHRVNLGPKFSEGARRLWRVVERERLSHGQIRARLGGGADVSRILYGDRVPLLPLLLEIHRAFGIPPELWARPPQRPFTPPGARAA